MEENKERVPQSGVMMLSPVPAFGDRIIPDPVAKCNQNKTPGLLELSFRRAGQRGR